MKKNFKECKEIFENYSKCQSCAYLLLKEYFCERDLAVYLCPFYQINESKEMSKVSEMEMAYGEYLND